MTCACLVSIARDGRNGCGGRVGDRVLAELGGASNRSW